MNRPETTLFMLMSVDGKISTGDTDIMDVDKDFPKITGIKEGLRQYYEIEKTTDLFSLNTGRVFAKIGFNEKTDVPAKIPVVFVVIDSRPHLKEQGVRYLAQKGEKIIIVTTCKNHPAVLVSEECKNVDVIFYDKMIDFVELFEQLKTKYGATKMTIQSGGTLNSVLLRDGLVDRVLLVVAPALIGGKNTSSLIDGESLHSPYELGKIRPLKLIQAKPLENSYVLLEYKVINLHNN
jgi:2,5-diamino-6-(ribosylamino)-4(3H)-pyrimidinone 5'-phosphate reductase